MICDIRISAGPQGGNGPVLSNRLIWKHGFLAAAAMALALSACATGGTTLRNAVRSQRPLAVTHGATASSPGEVAGGHTAAWYTRYTLRLDLEAGGEQSVVVMAPPGGLQLAVRDMTGDKVPNDVVVTPALLHWPLTVLVNDGNNHFTVAISAKSPDSAASDQSRASGNSQAGEISALASTGFKTHVVGNRGGISPLRLPEGPYSFISPSTTPLHTTSYGSGRAPPSIQTSI